MQEHKSLAGLIFNMSYPANLSLAFNINNNELFIGDESYTRLVQRTGHAWMFGLYSMPSSFRTIFIINIKEHNSLQLDTSPYPDTATWFRPNQCLFLLFVTVCLSENQQAGLKHTIYYRNSCNLANHFTTVVVNI